MLPHETGRLKVRLHLSHVLCPHEVFQIPVDPFGLHTMSGLGRVYILTLVSCMRELQRVHEKTSLLVLVGNCNH